MILRLSAVVCLLVTALDAQGQLSQTPNKKHPVSPPKQQVQVISYWTDEAGWHSELQLRNNLRTQELSVIPVLRSPEGDEYPLPEQIVKPQEVLPLDLSVAVKTYAPALLGRYGSLALKYISPSSGTLYAALMVHDMGHPIAFHIDASAELDSPAAISREGIWWLPRDTTNDYLVLTNQGNNALPVQLSVYDPSGRESKTAINLTARQMSRVSVRQLLKQAGVTTSFGGIKASASSNAGSLDTLHVVFDETIGFSATLKMFDHDPQAKIAEHDFAGTGIWTTRAPMLALSIPDTALAFPQGTILEPQILIRNTTDVPQQVSLRFNWRNDQTSGKAPGPSVNLQPHETKRVDVASLQDDKAFPKTAHWASVILSTSGPPGSVMAVATSYDTSLLYGAQTPFSDQLNFSWEGGLWEYNAFQDSLITVGNGGTKPMRARFTIFYNRGASTYNLEQSLQPDEHMWIDVGKLIRNRVPDMDGKTLPADLTSGSYEFQDLSDQGVGGLFEGKVIYDKKNGHVAYGCAYCCGYQDGAWLEYDPLSLSLTAPTLNSVYATNACTSQDVDVGSHFYWNWATGDTSIATVDGYGTHTGMADGSTFSSTSGNISVLNGRWCPLARQAPQGTVNVLRCPTSVVIDQTWSQPLQNDFPQFTTGVGILTRMKVGPVGTNFNQSVMSESVTPTGNNCPASIRGATDFPTVVFSSFVVGNGAGWEGTNYPSTNNAYYDQHTFKWTNNVLSGTDVSSCQSTATQTYSCNGIVVGSFSLTATFQSGYIGTIPVTFVTVSKQ